MHAARPAELSALRELVGTLQQALELARQENVFLRQKIDSLVRRVFGASSEWLDRAQLELLLQLPVPAQANPSVTVAGAIEYALGQWRTLEVYLTDGRVEIDNNLVENAIRPTALGKKNWLFIGDAQAGERSAIIYTIIESCRRRGLDPYAYLKDVLTRLPHLTNRQIPEVTPAAWAKAQRTLQVQLAS